METKIQFIHDGVTYAMTEAEIEAAYRYRLHGYLVEDAQNHLDNMTEDGSAFETEYGITVKEAYADDMLDRYVAQYERCHDCDIDENSQWEVAISNVLLADLE